jgi:hypothetical protein
VTIAVQIPFFLKINSRIKDLYQSSMLIKNLFPREMIFMDTTEILFGDYFSFLLGLWVFLSSVKFRGVCHKFWNFMGAFKGSFHIYFLKGRYSISERSPKIKIRKI